MSKYKLTEIAEIISGYTFRSAIKNADFGNYKVIQAQDIANDLEVNPANLSKTNLEKFNANALIKKNDIILTSKGRHKAAIVTSLEPMIASSSVFIVRIKDQKVDPYYLAIFLNSLQGQAALEKVTSGNYIKFISKAHLQNLVVQVPTLAEQKKITNLNRNVNQQQYLLKKKAKILNNIFENLLNKTLN